MNEVVKWVVVLGSWFIFFALGVHMGRGDLDNQREHVRACEREAADKAKEVRHDDVVRECRQLAVASKRMLDRYNTDVFGDLDAYDVSYERCLERKEPRP